MHVPTGAAVAAVNIVCAHDMVAWSTFALGTPTLESRACSEPNAGDESKRLRRALARDAVNIRDIDRYASNQATGLRFMP
jgi:hypothetical protein